MVLYFLMEPFSIISHEEVYAHDMHKMQLSKHEIIKILHRVIRVHKNLCFKALYGIIKLGKRAHYKE